MYCLPHLRCLLRTDDDAPLRQGDCLSPRHRDAANHELLHAEPHCISISIAYLTPAACCAQTTTLHRVKATVSPLGIEMLRTSGSCMLSLAVYIYRLPYLTPIAVSTG